MKREEGYYWVMKKNNHKWEIAYYEGNGKWVTWNENYYSRDTSFEEIDETPITRKP